MSLITSFSRPTPLRLYGDPIASDYLSGAKTHGFAGYGNVTIINGQIHYSPIYIAKRTHVVALAIAVSVQSGTGGAKARLALFTAVASTGAPGSLIVDAGEVAIDSTGLKDSSAIDQWIDGDTWVYRAINASHSGASLSGFTAGPVLSKNLAPASTPPWSLSETFAYAAMPLSATIPGGASGGNIRTVMLKVAP